ncbi:MMPL family transporter [Leucobacter triazinivorans]|uniref:MMPL family transporter n=1 Tax=Leucobacter triazinivorans TaxID=1784719 RepID=A0A4P6KHX0_9MICO|nr:MMPL family transporter [Leucobacter triazinivorans]QBE49671.1 MMPL family transporter [Leucobacter triazinivorans]
MSSLLYRWGALAYRGKWWVTAIWVVLIAAIVGLIVMSPPKLSNEIRIDGTAAQEVIDDLADRLPDASGGQGILALHSTDGERIDEGDNLAALLDAVEEVYAEEHVIDAREVMADELAKGPESLLLQASGAIAQAQAAEGTPASDAPMPLVVEQMPVPGVVISADGETALFQFVFDAQTFELPEGTVDDTIEAAESAFEGENVEVLPSSTMIQIPELIGVGEVVGVLIAALVLIVTLGSLVAAGLPLVSALSGVAVGVGGAFAISSFVPMHSLTAVLGLMLGLAVGIDYALFIVNRQRRFILDQRLTAPEATARAIGTAGSAVFFAGTTVIIALLALMVVQIQLLTTMALTAAATVLIAVLSAITLLPALLGFIGERICSKKARLNAGTAHDTGSSHRIANTWSRLLVKNRWVAAVGAVVIAGVIAAPVLDMNLGLPSGASYNPDTPQRDSFEVTSDAFGEGYNGPLVVVATSPDDETIPATDLAALYTDLSNIDGVEAVSLGGLDDEGTTAVFSLVPETAPTSQETADLVTHIRDLAPEFADDYGVDLGITGFAALAIDVSERLADVLPLYIGVVVGLSLIVLLLVFRSIIVPLKATLGFLLSVAATFGATTAVFQWGWLQPVFGMDATAPVLSLLPIIITGVLYGLAMDYEVFLVSSMKEAHVHGYQGTESVTRGFAVASRVVVAAAIIMTSVFAGFIFNPEPMIAQVGFALAFGILVDAFLVRMTLVPAVMAIFGDKAWWLPRWLDRALPDLDIEGDKLTKQLERA